MFVCLCVCVFVCFLCAVCRFVSTKSIKLCSNMSVRGVFTSDTFYRETALPKPMKMFVPKVSATTRQMGAGQCTRMCAFVCACVFVFVFVCVCVCVRVCVLLPPNMLLAFER